MTSTAIYRLLLLVLATTPYLVTRSLCHKVDAGGARDRLRSSTRFQFVQCRNMENNHAEQQRFTPGLGLQVRHMRLWQKLSADCYCGTNNLLDGLLNKQHHRRVGKYNPNLSCTMYIQYFCIYMYFCIYKKYNQDPGQA